MNRQTNPGYMERLLAAKEKRLAEVTDQYKSLEKDWLAASNKLAELEARDAVAYMNAVADRETRAAEGRAMQAEQELAKEKRENKRLREALEFYADQDSYYRNLSYEFHSMYDYVSEPSEADDDGGARAREALKQ
jgi:hypothetical protein